MPAPKQPADHKAKVVPNPRAKIVGKVFTWTTEDDATITIPLRINMEVLEDLPDGEMSPTSMMEMVAKIAPGQRDTIRATDIHDFTACFSAWQDAYNTNTGATLGESSDSST